MKNAVKPWTLFPAKAGAISITIVNNTHEKITRF